MDMFSKLVDLGFAPYCPHLTHFLHLNKPLPYEKWLELDMEYLKICDALFRLEGISNGADKEIELANSLKIPVFYSLNELQTFNFQK